MTIIAYRDGVMAADSAITADGLHIGTATKIVRAPDGALGAASGDGSFCHQFSEWFQTTMPRLRAPETEKQEFYAIIVNADSRCFEVNHTGIMVPIDAEFLTAGSGWKFAYGAMAAGASAEEAVNLCIKHCTGIRGPVQVETLIRQ